MYVPAWSLRYEPPSFSILILAVYQACNPPRKRPCSEKRNSLFATPPTLMAIILHGLPFQRRPVQVDSQMWVHLALKEASPTLLLLFLLQVLLPLL